MSKKTGGALQFVGLDVHADTIAVAVAEPDGTVRSVGVIPNRPESIRKLVKRLGSPEQLVLPSSSVGDMRLRLYALINYGQVNSSHLPCALNWV